MYEIKIFVNIFFNIISMNTCLCVFNLIPIPPLIPAKAGPQADSQAHRIGTAAWVPAFAGMSGFRTSP